MRKIKQFIYSVLYSIGFYNLWRKSGPKGIVVLTAHGVVDDAAEAGDWTPMRPRLSSKLLEETVKLASKYYDFVTLDDAIEMLAGRREIKNNSIVMTFDDGYKNNIEIAWPILKKHNIPAILFPSVGHVERGEPFWYDRLDYLIQKAIENNLVSCELLGKEISLDTNTGVSVRQCVMNAIGAVKEASGNDTDVMQKLSRDMQAIEEKLKININEYLSSDISTAVASWEELEQAMKDGLDIGSHTINHARLSLTTEDKAREELIRSKEFLEDKLGFSCKFVCYPNGCFNDAVKRLAREAGYEAGLATREGINYVGDDLMQIRRFHIPQNRASGAEALAIASGLSFKIHKIKRKLMRNR